MMINPNDIFPLGIRVLSLFPAQQKKFVAEMLYEDAAAIEAFHGNFGGMKRITIDPSPFKRK